VDAGNIVGGFVGGTSPAVLNIEDSDSEGNGTGVICNAGTTVRLANSTIAGNTTTLTGTCSSYKNNNIDTIVTLTPINPQ
jgi:hypothetical protein